MRRSDVVWTVGSRIPRRLGDLIAGIAAPVLNLLPLPAVEAWQDTIEQATGQRPHRSQRVALLRNWLRNNLWSLSLARWSDADVLAVADVSDDDVAALRASIAGPGLVLALPHMGSWDFAGAWAARVGIAVTSVAERLPDGLYERFRDARAAMGMRIYPVDQPNLMRALADDVRAGRAVCLLSDRDLSSKGVRVPWPGGGELSVPAGPALLARRTGADLRVVTTHFEGPRLRIEVSEPVSAETIRDSMSSVVAGFADAVRRHPESWLMLRRALR